MLTRRQFLRASALVSAGLIAADQLEILDKLAPRSLFASAEVPPTITLGSAYGVQWTSGYSVSPIAIGTRDDWRVRVVPDPTLRVSPGVLRDMLASIRQHG